MFGFSSKAKENQALPVYRTNFSLTALTAALVLSAVFPVHAANTAAEMQRQLNKEVMSSPFDPGDVAKAEAWAKDAQKKDLQPVKVAPNYWRPGWTCANLTSYRYYRYRDYRNCIYYRRYYGRYW